MTDQTCPNCGLKLVQNKWGDLVCPNCGIIKYHKEKLDKTPSYLG